MATPPATITASMIPIVSYATQAWTSDQLGVHGNGMLSHFRFSLGVYARVSVYMIKMYTQRDEQEKSYIWHALAVRWQLQFAIHQVISLISVHSLKTGITKIVKPTCWGYWLTHLIWTVIHTSLRVDKVVAVGCPLVNFALDNHSCDELISWHSKPNGYHQRMYAPLFTKYNAIAEYTTHTWAMWLTLSLSTLSNPIKFNWETFYATENDKKYSAQKGLPVIIAMIADMVGLSF